MVLCVRSKRGVSIRGGAQQTGTNWGGGSAKCKIEEGSQQTETNWGGVEQKAKLRRGFSKKQNWGGGSAKMQQIEEGVQQNAKSRWGFSRSAKSGKLREGSANCNKLRRGFNGFIQQTATNWGGGSANWNKLRRGFRVQQKAKLRKGFSKMQNWEGCSGSAKWN